jgi:rhodanese-related sulfurtransferase
MIPLQADCSQPGCATGLRFDLPVAVYCAAGGRAAMAAQALERLGYQTVYNLGSFSAWQASGGQVEQV